MTPEQYNLITFTLLTSERSKEPKMTEPKIPTCQETVERIDRLSEIKICRNQVIEAIESATSWPIRWIVKDGISKASIAVGEELETLGYRCVYISSRGGGGIIEITPKIDTTA